MQHLKTYLKILSERGKKNMADSVKETADTFSNSYLDPFSFTEHEIGLLFGNVQAGKTAQMFGILCAAADRSFPLFILLTTDNKTLQEQTYNRVQQDLSDCGFCICGEYDTQKFVENELIKPTIIVLKKNSRVLLQWYNTLASTSFVRGNALFVIDDEADAASPNTLINQKRTSTINNRLANIRNASIGSIYLEVTGTPQALLLQSAVSNFRPAFTCYFEPGIGYLGGDFFFGDPQAPYIRYIGDSYTSNTHSIEKNGLYKALLHHLIVSAQLLSTGHTVCNFVIHPGTSKSSHEKTKDEVLKNILQLQTTLKTPAVITDLKKEYIILSPCTSEKKGFDDLLNTISRLLVSNSVNVMVMNGDSHLSDSDYSSGSNIIIGGNVLGRGVTFPKLQTLYYTRSAKKPQADTMWQHSRMFGYDRDAGMMAVFITEHLYKLFSDINAGNNSMVSQIQRGIENIKIYYPEGLSPTRKNVIDMKRVDLIAGGTNYYPNNPDNDSIEEISSILRNFLYEPYYQTSLKLFVSLLKHISSDDDFDVKAFSDALASMLAENPAAQGILIVRQNRNITQGTGAILSPNDWNLGAQFTDKPVLTMYQVTGTHGWHGKKLWVPNIKLPNDMVYYNVKEQ